MRNFDHDEYRMRGHRIINEPEGFGAPGMGSARCMPRGFDSPHGMPPFGGPGFDGPNFGGPSFGGPGHGMGPGHGRPPRRPDPRFLRQRLEDADLADLIDMAGRMLRRPEPAGAAAAAGHPARLPQRTAEQAGGQGAHHPPEGGGPPGQPAADHRRGPGGRRREPHGRRRGRPLRLPHRRAAGRPRRLIAHPAHRVGGGADGGTAPPERPEAGESIAKSLPPMGKVAFAKQVTDEVPPA